MKNLGKNWVCVICGKSTKETDYDYLVNSQLHLECQLKKETEKTTEETTEAKIRNQLGPYWNLIGMIKEYDKHKNPKLWDYIKRDVSVIEENQDKLLKLIDGNG